VFAYTFDGAWFDIGTPESYLEAVAWELDGGVQIAESATVEGSEIGNNVHVLDGASLINSNVDGSVIFPQTTIRDCEIRNSIIDRETHVENLDLADALIGAHTQITNGNP
jgi:glucose-1-phosphate thymidylyltransferase